MVHINGIRFFEWTIVHLLVIGFQEHYFIVVGAFESQT